MSTVSPAGWSKWRKRSETIEIKEGPEVDGDTTPKANRKLPQTLFASFREDLQSAIGNLNGRDLLQLTEGTRIALKQDAEGQWAWAFVPPATLDEGVRDEGTWPRAVNVMGYYNAFTTDPGTRLIGTDRDIRTISRDEWDQYKCGTQQYQCYIPRPPEIPIVRLRDNSRVTPLTPPSPSPAPEPAPRSSRKRRLSDTGFATTEGRKRAKIEGSPSKHSKVIIDLESDVSRISASPSESDADVEEIVHIRPQRPPQRSKPHSKGKERDRLSSHPGLRPPGVNIEELYSLGTPPALSSTVYARGTSKPPEMKTSMDTDPAAQLKRRRTSNTNEERITIVDHLCTESSDPDRSNVKRRRLSPDTLQQQANQKLRERKLREEQRRQHLASPSSIPLSTTSRTKRQPNEKDFWSSVDFSSLKGQQFDLEESPAPPGPPTISEVNEDEEDGDDETETEDEDEFFHSPESEPQRVHELDPDRLAAINESKRKLAELERDRPIWDAAAELKRKLAETQRRLQEEKERADRLARKETERLEKIRLDQLAEQARRARRQAEEMQRRKWAEDAAQAQKRAQEARRKLSEEAERLREQQRRSEWRFFEEFLGTGGWQYGSGSTRFPGWGGTGGPSSHTRPPGTGASPNKSINSNGWTPRKALDWYNKLATEFDSLRVSEASPLDMSKIPWPVLHAPGYQLAQVDWNAVEAFFSQAEVLLGGKRSTAWKELLKSSARRFHPDRWRARGLIGPYGGGQEVEERVNDVAKVLNPLYKEVS
jgi:hypothetical protein